MPTAYLYSCVCYSSTSMQAKGSVFRFEKPSYRVCFWPRDYKPFKLITSTQQHNCPSPKAFQSLIPESKFLAAGRSLSYQVKMKIHWTRLIKMNFLNILRLMLLLTNSLITLSFLRIYCMSESFSGHISALWGYIW